jgi:hypothetical protein
MPTDETDDKNADVRGVFDLWVGLLRSSSRVKPRLDEKRAALIRRAVRDYGAETCGDAVRGCSVSDFHLGRNPRGKVYTDIELILRDSKHIEQFAGIWHEHVESGAGEADAAREGDAW